MISHSTGSQLITPAPTVLCGVISPSPSTMMMMSSSSRQVKGVDLISDDRKDGRREKETSRGRNPDQLSAAGPTPCSQEAGRSCGSVDGRQHGAAHGGRRQEEPGETGW